MSVTQAVANKIAPESGEQYMYPGCEFACSGSCCLGYCCPCIAAHQNWNAAGNVAKGRAEEFDNKGLLMCLMVLFCVWLGSFVPGIYAVGHFIQRMMLAKAMKFEPYGPCPDLICSLLCWGCTYHQDTVAVEQYKARPQKGLVGAALGAVGGMIGDVAKAL